MTSVPAALETPQVTQNKASDPERSAWVSASAGTGKTRVLTDRVLRLLLGGTPPDRLLCITFTKAAAAEMAKRVHATLANWAIWREDKLDGHLAELGERPNEALRRRARRLFAQVLDAPAGLPIQTVHAFCQSVLRRFPLEAGVSPQFELIEDRVADERIRQARDRVLATTDPDLRAAVDLLARLVDEGRFGDLVDLVIAKRARLARMFAGLAPGEELRARVAAQAGADPAADRETVLAAACAETAFDGAALRRAAAALDAGGKEDRGKVPALTAFLAAAAADRPALFAAYALVFLKQDGTPRARQASKSAEDKAPGTVAAMEAEALRLEAVRGRLLTIATVERTTALLTFARALLAAYEADKQRQGALDYTDLVLRTADLLDRPGMADWVLFKLDGGIDHVLVDEAQDTNTDQWRVITALTAEFVAGEGARSDDTRRTVFAVGDEKQSIFSFQGADPRTFDAVHRHLAARLEGGPAPLAAIPMHVSFRSVQAVLDWVDAVFAEPEARAGVVVDPMTEVRHVAHRRGQAGLVELWEPIGPAETDERAPWEAPVDQRLNASPSARLAGRIAETVRGWLDRHEVLESQGRPIGAGDVLVLVRTRDAFFAELVRALKDRAVPVAGVDRMQIPDQLAAQDLAAAAAAALLPDDDLTLAAVLKGPFVGFDEEALFAVAHGRDGRSLWQALNARADAGNAACGAAVDWLRRLRRQVGRSAPHELVSALLTRPCPADAGCGRRALLARLGPDAADAIDEVLTLALDYERTAAPSVQGFVHWLAASDTEVKRELETGDRGQVRIMTVHAAKGLQAPIVILAGALQKPERTDPVQWPGDPGAPPLWAPRADLRDPASASLALAAAEWRDAEYRRLLYVALTRAEDRLYVCGHRGPKAPPERNWHALCAAGLDRLAGVEALTAPDGLAVRRYICTQHTPVAPQEVAAAALGVAPPEWLFRLPGPEPEPPRPLAPSRPEEGDPPVRSPLDEAGPGRRFRRGLLVHALLQRLPDLAADRRTAWARRYLARTAPDWPVPEALVDEALGVLAHPGLAPAFGPGSRAEVPIVGVVGGQAVAGQVDRLAVLDDRVIVFDYKTNRPPPASEADTAPAYLRQMAIYRAALRAIYPGRKVLCALVWTDGARVMQLSDAALDRWAPA
ncbi:MAG: double-strand break repair helicase AddA [Rhodospirillaceae bacterium]|nr:double-strand break repair helicase AddA [Rhodospirillaceae bacterium]